MSCEVCVEKFNRSTRKPVCCSKCEYIVCRTCCETYILGSGKLASCMNCNVTWDLAFMKGSFTKKFLVNEYRSFRTKLLFDAERILFPQTQVIMEYKLQLQRLNMQIAEFSSVLIDKRKELRTLLERLTGLHQEIKRKGVEVPVLQQQIVDVHQSVDTIRKEHDEISIMLTSKVAEKNNLDTTFRARNVSVMTKCPSAECRGYLNNDFCCGLCNVVVCQRCHEIQDDKDHVCDANAVANVKLISTETRSCPKCMVKISKIDGCDQMFCIKCHTAFSWNTGLIENGTIHNPHYIEMMRQGRSLNRNLLEVRCGREIDMTFIESNYERGSDQIHQLCFIVMTLRTYYLPVYVNAASNNQDLREKYLGNLIPESEFQRLLYIRARDTERQREMGYVLHMFVNVMTEIIYRYFAELTETGLVQNEIYINETRWVSEYTREHLNTINTLYNSKDRSIINHIRIFRNFH